MTEAMTDVLLLTPCGICGLPWRDHNEQGEEDCIQAVLERWRRGEIEGRPADHTISSADIAAVIFGLPIPANAVQSQTHLFPKDD